MNYDSVRSLQNIAMWLGGLSIVIGMLLLVDDAVNPNPIVEYPKTTFEVMAFGGAAVCIACSMLDEEDQ